MKTIFMRPWILVAILLSGYSLNSIAQMYGSGMLGGMQACPYRQEIGDAAEDKMDDIREANEDLKELRSKISEEKSNKREIESKMKRSRDNLERRAFKSDYLARILDHIENQRECDKYERHDAKPVAKTPPPAPSKGGDSRKPQSDDSNSSGNDEKGKTTVSGDGRSISPYQDSEWSGPTCDPAKGGRIMSTACDVESARIEKLFNVDACVTNLKSYQDAKLKLIENEKKLADLDNQEAFLKDKIAGLKSDMKAATREHQKEMRKEMTEGGCVDCMLQGSGYYYSSSKPNWGGVITNSVLGLGSMLLGNNLQKYVANQNSRLGNQSQSYPSFGYGFPFIMGAMSAAMGGGGGGGFYGAVGGGMGGGAFGCGSGMGGNGYGNMVGGPFGYPAGMFGTPYGGGLFTGYPVGMMAGGMGMFVGGQIMMGGGMQMGGMPMGGYMMGGMPMGMMAGGQMMGGMPMGMMAGGQMMMGGMPMGMMAGGQMMGGMPMGMMAGGQMMMGGMPMGNMMGAMGAMGTDSSAMMQMQMQMQQQAMQMQQQQMNAYMQQQQRAQENYMNGSRVVSGLYMQLQQAIMSLNTGGYFNFGSAGGSIGVGGSLYQPGMPGGSMLPGQIPGAVPGAMPGAVTPNGPSTSR